MFNFYILCTFSVIDTTINCKSWTLGGCEKKRDTVQQGNRSWNVTYSLDIQKLRISFKLITSKGAATGGSWKCKYGIFIYDQYEWYHRAEWKRAHRYENNGYLYHEILFKFQWTRYCQSKWSWKIECEETYSKFINHRIMFLVYKNTAIYRITC